MKGIFCAVLFLACACLIFKADAAFCQPPEQGDYPHVLVKGRPWETDESKDVIPGQQFSGRGESTRATGAPSSAPSSLLQQRASRGHTPAPGPLPGGCEHPFDFHFIIHLFCR
jgi:hypothetical protein